MLPKKNRLNLKTKLGREIFKYKTNFTNGLDIYYNKKNKKIFKAAVVVPTKAVKSAVYRNKIRRDIFNLIRGHNISRRPADLLVLVKKKEFVLDKKEEFDFITQLDSLLNTK
jgi:ribonuclease P protein component